MSLAPDKNHNAIPLDRRGPGYRDGPGAPNAGDGEPIGDYATVTGDDEPTMIDLPDGSSIATIGDAVEHPLPPAEAEFYGNLADGIIPEHVLDRVATDLLRRIEEDKRARSDRDKQYEEGIKRSGLGNDAPGGAEFTGASRVVHPLLTEASIDYEARVMKEIWPPSGPVKEDIVGVVTSEKTERAKRKTEHMNWQLTKQMKEARSVMETTLTQVPLGGSQFIKQWWDHKLARPRWQFVPIDRIYLPYNAADFASSPRKTFTETIGSVEFQQRVESGLYRRIENLPSASMLPEVSKAEQASDKVEGLTDPGMNVDGDREIFEVQTYLEITDDMELDHETVGQLYPYLISIDESSKKVLGFYRDWEERDPACEPIDHLFELPFIKWRGAFGIGFPQIIGLLSGAATGALRALLDSAHANNSATGFILKGSGTSGQSTQPKIGELVEIDGGLETDDIRKRIMPSVFNPPAPVLFQLLGFLVDAGKGVVRTSLDETQINPNANVPVGTQLSRVEEGLVVFSSIHGRIHAAMNRIIEGLHRLNRMYLPDQLRVDLQGREILVKRSDYEGPCDTQPVSDPTIFSDQQRFWQLTAVEQSAMANPNIFDMRKVQERKLKLLKVPDYDELLIPAPEPQEMNAVNECLAMSMGRPAAVFPEQNHLAHLQVHLDFGKSPFLGMNPLIAQKYQPQALSHIAQHIVMFYVQRTVELVEGASEMKAVDLMSNDDAVKKKFDELLALASGKAIPEVEAALQGAMPVIQQAVQYLKSMQPPQPVDPGTAAVQAAQAETARKAAADQAGHQLEAQQQQSDAQIQQQKNAIMAERNQIEQANAQLAAQTKLQTTQIDVQAARDVAETKATTGSKSSLTDGASLEGV